MTKYVLNRVLVTLPLVALVAFGTFALVHLIPGDSAYVVAGENASVERVAEVRSQLGLDRSFFEQFAEWLVNALQGDFGISAAYNQPVTSLIFDRAGVTLSLTVVGLLFAVVIGIPAGVYAGTRAGSPMDRVITALTTTGIAIPAFWLAMLLVVVFSIQLGWFRSTGYTRLSDDPIGWMHSMILPGIAIAAASAADIARQTRASIADAMKMPNIRTATAMGLGRGAVVYRHALRQAGVPIVTVAGVQVERLISGVVAVEIIFSMPGLGTFLVDSALAQDVPVIQGIVVFIAVGVILTNLVVDMSYAWINPRMRRA